ncbi:hypothetical protein [Oryzobacter terrae]|uniref:hypothetical protein n=1 Tax=Oryzobacter terrae TaxID=1620385 RepID=UPI0036715B68
MRTTRALLGLMGVALAAYGLLRLFRLPGEQVLAVGVWVAGGIVAHDGLLAPAVVGLGVLAALRADQPWRRPLLWLLVVLGPLTIVAVPVLGRFGARPDNPSLLDRPYLLGYGAIVAVAVAATLVAGLRARREGP